MILHALKLVWQRKRANALVMIEIFFSFLIVFAVVTLAVSLFSRWQTPLGFSWKDVWVMDIEPGLQGEHSETRTTPDTAEMNSGAAEGLSLTERLMREMRAFPQVEAVGADAMPPYTNREWQTGFGANGRRTLVVADQATEGFAAVMQIRPIAGRWFSREDDAQNYVPLVMDTDAAEKVFGTKDVVGRKFSDDHFGPTNELRELRVIGVIPPFRQQGELFNPKLSMVFFGASSAKPWEPAPRQLVIRVRPGTPAVFEADMTRRLHAVAPDVNFRLRKMEDMRRTTLKMAIAPVAALLVIALFLISMVALGLTGVLWQTVTRRMREIGLRRAIGATGAAVRRQVLIEVALIATLAVSLGVVIVLQLPLLGLSAIVTGGEFATGLVAALAVIYAITLLCGAYPSWLASTVDPAVALRYE